MENERRLRNEASARILAATLTLISREQRGLPPPFSLWYPEINSKFIKELALDVAFDRSRVLWADDGHPARGFVIFHPQELETALLGSKSARLKGPFVVDADPASRQRLSLNLALKGISLGLREDYRFLSAKLPHDPSMIRGFAEAGFSVAEVTSVLSGPVSAPEISGLSREPDRGAVIVKSAEEEDASELLSRLGDLFYDGHHRHGPFLPEDFSRRLWRALAEKGLREGDLAVFARGEREGTLAFAMAGLSGEEAVLNILHVNPDKRGQGLGRRVLNELLKELFSKGARRIKAETASWNLPALSLYISLGLRPAAPLMAMHAKLVSGRGREPAALARETRRAADAPGAPKA
jgi:ribosomal protein S18 acetylase RimI-like enzyme